MPIYEYYCNSCGKTFELMRKYQDRDNPVSCKEVDCEETSSKFDDCSKKRIMSKTSFALKGSGWYATDYKNK